MCSVVFNIVLCINRHSIKNCIHYCAIQFMICSLYKIVQVIFKFKVVLFCFTEREKFLSDSYYDINMTFFSLSSNGIEEV